MARRPKEDIPKPSPPVDDEGNFCLSGDRLWKYRALDAELRTAMIALDSVKREIAAEIAKHPELTSLMGKQLECFGALGTAKAEFTTFQAEIEALFGVSLKECAFDDRTGRLHHLSDGGEPGDPMKAKKTTTTKKRTPR